MIKKLTYTIVICLSLTACESISSPQWPSLSSLNPFENNDAQSDIADKTSLPKKETSLRSSASAIKTELDEMEMLTGERFATNKPLPSSEIHVETIKAVEPTVTDETPIAMAKKQEIKQEIKQDIAPLKIKTKNNPSPQPTPKSDNSQQVHSNGKINGKSNDKKPTEIGKPQTITSKATSCPQIEIAPFAKSITYFDKDNPQHMTARASISDIRGGCEFVDGGMEVDLDILMNGTVTNKGRFEGKVDEEAFMTFPYYVSIIAPHDSNIEKKILATAMRFRPLVDYLDHAEKITQFIPMNDPSLASQYVISVGFQLTRDQLNYNNIKKASKPNDKRASPDTIPARRRSVNPLAEE